MLERPALYNRAYYSRLETLITDDAQLMELSPTVESTALSVIADDFVLKLLWEAQMGSVDYPFEPAAIRAKRIPVTKTCTVPWQRGY